MNFLIMIVSLFLTFHVNSCLGISNPKELIRSGDLCRPSNPTKSNCLNDGCICAWCSLSITYKFEELSEHNKNKGPLGKCFTYRRHHPAVNTKRCGNVNVTIYTYANFGRCKHMYTGLYIFICVVIGLVGIGVSTVCISGAIGWLRNQR